MSTTLKQLDITFIWFDYIDSSEERNYGSTFVFDNSAEQEAINNQVQIKLGQLGGRSPSNIRTDR